MKFIYFALILILFVFTNCKPSHDEIIEIRKDFLAYHQAEIEYYSEDDTTPVFLTSDKETIKIILSGIGNKDTEEFKCGYSGAIVLRDTITKAEQRIDFNLKPDCAHFSFLYKEKLYFKKLNKKAVEFFKKIK